MTASPLAVVPGPLPVEEIRVVETGRTSPLADRVDAAFARARALQGKLDARVLDIEGMSGRKYRYFINNLVETVDQARYLEIGSWAGSTFCSAIFGNNVTATAIDNWSEFGGPINHFFYNVAHCCSKDTRISTMTRDFRQVDYGAIGLYNIYLFDGPHQYQDQYDGLAYPLRALDAEFVFIVDDWNWEPVRKGTMDAIRALGVQVVRQIEVFSNLENSHPAIAGKASDWHNGYFISVLRKPTA